MIDGRFYRLIRCHYKEPPEPGSVFPLLADVSPSGSGTDEDDDDASLDADAASFGQVAAAFSHDLA